MRITVNLSLFFHDHRCLAKIFINKNIKSIQDLENRISEIFNIHDFYLKCDNQYLPPSEEVQVLAHEDIVWVLPKNEGQLWNERNLTLDNTVDLEENDTTYKKKKKNKKKRTELSVVDDNDVPVKEKKKKKREKRKHEREESPERNEQSSEDTPDNNDTIKPEKKLKLKVQKPRPVTPDDLLVSKDSGRDSLDSSKSDEVEHQSKSVNVKTLVDSFENKKDLKMFLEHSFTPVLPKKTNIVKTIIISNNKHKPDTETPTTSNTPINSSTELPETSTIKLNSSQEMEDFNQINGTDGGKCVKTNEESDLTNSYCATSDVDSVDIKKRKRKRVRKRKHPNRNQSLEEDNSQKPESVVFNLIPRPLLARNNGGRHVRFKEDTIPTAVSAVTINEPAVNNQNIEPANNATDVNESIKSVDVTKVINFNELTEEFILKQPLMKNIQPRAGDVIGFKIIRISEQYTPELSGRIVGRVINRDLDKGDITFDVLDGREQYAQPQGKFSIDLNNEEETPAEETTDSTFQCVWSSLLDPRLLYP